MLDPQRHQNMSESTNSLSTLSLEERIKIADNIREISLRTVGLNPVYPKCMIMVNDLLDMGELKIAVEFFFQSILNPKDALIDVSLHDFIYMVHIRHEIGIKRVSISNVVQALQEEVLKLYS